MNELQSLRLENAFLHIRINEAVKLLEKWKSEYFEVTTDKVYAPLSERDLKKILDPDWPKPI